MNPVWQAIATFLIRKRVFILVILGVFTLVMWIVRGTEIAHELTQVVPMNDGELVDYLDFKEEFGEDGNVLVVGVEGKFFEELDLFNGIYDLVEELKEVEGVENVVSITHLFKIETDTVEEKFQIAPLISQKPKNKEELKNIVKEIKKMPFYDGLLIDKEEKTTLLAISIVDTFLNSERKVEVYDRIKARTSEFEKAQGMSLRYAGFPVIRVNIHKTVAKELVVFLILALIVTGITLWMFFRSIHTVIFPMLVVCSVIICSVGIIGLFGYKIGLVTGVIPALITVISIPNCVYLITKYHIEYRMRRNKMKSLILVIEKIGIVTIMTNATTAVGLGVLAFADVGPLREFGVVAGLSVIAAFFISLLLIPIVFSFLPPPTSIQTRHLDRRVLGVFINFLDRIVLHHRWAIYTISIALVGFSLYGMMQILPVAYIVDDIPRDSKVLKDMRYIEDRFNGALPFEILIDTKRKNGVQRLSNLRKINELQERLSNYDDLSRAVSLADVTMFLRQAFWGGDSADYLLPTSNEFNFIRSYLANSVNGDVGFNPNQLSKTMSDSLMQKTRISTTVKDIGSIKMYELIDSVTKDINEVFDTAKYDVTITGTTQMFIRGNEYLIDNLLESLAIAFLVIALIMGFLFRSVRMVLISLVPNILPLIMVAGVMGYWGIPLKPSTALVFGVAFGIAVDDSIHFLARFRLARKLGDSVEQAVSNSYKDTGVSMIYTSIILFFGFVIFTASSFGGTKALGLLTSMTLGIAMFSNLVLLPALLITFSPDKKKVQESSLSLEELRELKKAKA